MFSAVLSITTRQSQRDLTDLGALSPALESLVDVIGVDRDLVAVAAGGAPRAIAPSSRDLHRWVSGLDGREHFALLTRVARGDGPVSAELLRRFRQQASRQAARLAPAHC